MYNQKKQRKMKKKQLAILLFALITSLSVKAQMHYGVEAGYMRNTWEEAQGGNTDWTIGFIAKYEASEHFLFETGLSYKNKRATFTDLEPNWGPTENWGKVKTSMYFLDLPVMAGCKVPLSEKILLIPKLGWYASCGMNGSTEFFSREYKYVKESPIFYDPEAEYNGHSYNHPSPADRFDTGVKVGLDLQCSRLALRCAYNYGVLNHHYVYKNFKNRELTVTLAYYFK
jgi:hypothetical protein